MPFTIDFNGNPAKWQEKGIKMSEKLLKPFLGPFHMLNMLSHLHWNTAKWTHCSWQKYDTMSILMDTREMGCASGLFWEVSVESIGIHCNSCKSGQTTAVIFHKGASYKHLWATFQTYRRWVFGIQNTLFLCSIPLRLSVVSDMTKWLHIPSDARVCHWQTHHYFGLHVHNDT